jgi:hypothetical protein
LPWDLASILFPGIAPQSEWWPSLSNKPLGNCLLNAKYGIWDKTYLKENNVESILQNPNYPLHAVGAVVRASFVVADIAFDHWRRSKLCF